MVKKALGKVKPAKGYAHVAHLLLVIIFPILAYIFVRLDFILLAIGIVIISKWRIFAINPRYWLSHIRTNAVDIIVGLSFVGFMVAVRDSMYWQLIWLTLYEFWVLVIKPRESVFYVTLQALVAQFMGLVAMYLCFREIEVIIYVIVGMLISYFVGRHYFGTFDEPAAKKYVYLWVFFVGSLLWILNHWLFFYGPVAQPAAYVGVIGYGLGGLYYMHEHDRLTDMVRRQIIFATLIVVFIMLFFSNWRGEGVIK